MTVNSYYLNQIYSSELNRLVNLVVKQQTDKLSLIYVIALLFQQLILILFKKNGLIR